MFTVRFNSVTNSYDAVIDIQQYRKAKNMFLIIVHSILNIITEQNKFKMIYLQIETCLTVIRFSLVSMSSAS